MSYDRNKIVEQARAWLGYNEADGSHKKIIDVYNSHKPLARGYKVKYTDEWCATFVSAVSVACGYTDIIPTECSCPKMIELLKAKGSWMETDSYIPAPGDLLMYDWDDRNPAGENTNSPDHVGIVEKIENGVMTIIEGNYKNAVSRRELKLNGAYIRGFGIPKYDTETVKNEPLILRKGSKGAEVKDLQNKLISLGYDLGKYGADGDFGSATEKAVKKFQKDHSIGQDGQAGPLTFAALERALQAFDKTYSQTDFVKDVQRTLGATVDGIAGQQTLGKTITLSNVRNRKHAVVQYVQKRLYALGYTEVGEADGIFGSATKAAVKRFQKENDCVSDGEITAQKTTWKKLLGMK